MTAVSLNNCYSLMQEVGASTKFEVRIVDLITSFWDDIVMAIDEKPSTVEMVKLVNTTTRELQTLLAIGTADIANTNGGRVVLVSVDQLHSQANKVVCSQRMLYPVSAATASVQGKLLVPWGTNLTIHEWTGSKLNRVAKYDPHIRAVSLTVNEDIVLIGDIHESIYVLRWKENERSFTLSGKALSSHRCLSTGFLFEGKDGVFMFSNDERNVHKSNSSALLFCTKNGSIGCLAPLYAAYDKLLSLQ